VHGIQGIKARDIAKYALLPGFIPRINALLGSGFGWLAFTMAVIYNGVRLLPHGHPYLNPQNMGKYGIRHVVAEAANNIVVCRENIDQIVIFIAMLLGLVLLVLEVVAIILGLVIKPVFALGAFQGMFATPGCVAPGSACLDIAFMMLDKVFGVPEMYNSKFAPPCAGLGCVPPFNRAMQELFQYYNYAILVVGVVIFLYYVVVIVGETANTGTPFGRRFNHIYAPLRLVGAVGLLVPLNYGLNGAQYITLISARMGSGFATNGWIVFNTALAAEATPIGTRYETLLARPKPSDITPLVAFMSVVRTCKSIYELRYPSGPNRREIFPYLVKNDPNAIAQDAVTTPYAGALLFYENKDITIVFGHLFPADMEMNFLGNVEPTCGEIKIHTNVAGTVAGGAPPDQRIGPYIIQEAYYDLIINAWANVNLILYGDRMASIHLGIPFDPCAVPLGFGDCKKPPEAEFKTVTTLQLQTPYEAQIAEAYNQSIALGAALYDIPDDLLERGWAGAAIWYNHIAEWNGALFTAAINMPTPAKMPLLMEKIQEEKRSHNESVEIENRYEPVVQGSRGASVPEEDIQLARGMSAAYRYWFTDGRGAASDLQTSGNVFFDLLNAIFGIGGLFTIRENDDVHPLAQLSALGKSIIESSIRNLMTALVMSAGGGMGEIVGTHLGPALQSISGMFVAFATIGLAVGFILYYVLPFLPFIYFFFAVGSWVKTIFEAMVGAPLWALAHLRVDGNGFPGDTASNGYFLIFEIFVRPILTVFGLIAAMAIFSALARTLNGVFDLVVENLAGFDCADCVVGVVAGIEYKRNVIDEFFFTIIYTVLVYMLATSSFKLIDQIPNSILRWMGAGVQSFGDQHDDPAQGLTQYAAFGGANMAGQVAGALQQGARATGQGFGLLGRNLLPDENTAQSTGRTGSTPPTQ